jgi:hypothetical protein
MGDGFKTKKIAKEPIPNITYQSVFEPSTFDENFTFVKSSNDTFVPGFSTLVLDNDFVYFANGTGSGSPRINRLNKYDINNVQNLTVGSTRDGQFLTIDVDDAFVYAGGYTNLLSPNKFHKSNCVFTSSAPSGYGDWIMSLKVDDNFIYCVGLVANNIRKYHKGNLVSIGTSGNYGGWLYAITLDNDYCYIGGNASPGDVKRYHKGNLGFAGNTNSFGGRVTSIVVDNAFVYAASDSQPTSIKKWHKGNLAFVGASSSIPQNLNNNLEVDDNFIYYTSFQTDGNSPRNVYKLHKGNFATVAVSQNLTGENFNYRIKLRPNNVNEAISLGTNRVQKWTTRTEIPGAEDTEGIAIVGNNIYKKETLL